MRLTSWITAAVALATPLARAQEGAETHRYESDITRLRSLVIHSLYSHKDVFLRELLSNSNDALEKLRLTALTDRDVMKAGEANVTIEVQINEGGDTGHLILRDTGIGMTKEELAKNLGTIARSGTNEFLKQAEEGGGADSNLIGQFGLGFYSCFLVSPTVRVSSLPPATSYNPEPVQYTFTSTSSGDSFEIFADPRGNTLGRGTEIVLDIGKDDQEFLSVSHLKQLIDKHSAFSTTFPIFIKERKVSKVGTPEPKSLAKDGDEDPFEDDLNTDDQSVADEAPEEVVEEQWIRVNDQPPIWMREPKDVSNEEYEDFYKAIAKDQSAETLGWSHFKGDTGSGVSYRAIMYIPSSLPKDFWSKVNNAVNNVRLMVKRVFITDDLGEDYMPKWLAFLKVIVDADDLPLNVSRETLQNHRFLKQLQRILVRKAIDLFAKLASDEPKKFEEFSKIYGNALRVGFLDGQKDRSKLAKLLRFESTRSKYTSLEEYVENRKEGQKQIFYIAGVGEKTESLARSPFVEKLIARGYEVLLLNLPTDEPVFQQLGPFMGMTAQDVSKKGLKYGDEEEDEAEKKELEAQRHAFHPLIEWLRKDLGSQINDVVLTNRLVNSPCTIVVDAYGWSANMAKFMSAQAEVENDPMYQMMMKLPKTLEINPKSPLIEALLERVLELPEDDAIDEDLSETVSILLDTALIRSGFTAADPTSYFERVEAMLRRSLGVSEHAKANVKVKPAPPTASGPIPEDEFSTSEIDFSGLGDGQIKLSKSEGGAGGDEQWIDWNDIKKMQAEAPEHDEL